MKIFIKDSWFDITNWARLHPGGSEILKFYDGKDATDAFFSLHSNEAMKRLNRMKIAQPMSLKALQAPATVTDEVDEAYRRFRAQLEAAGWFHRSVFAEAMLLLNLVVLIVLGINTAWDYPLLSSIFLGLAMQQAGWLGHDMVHARNSLYCSRLEPYISGWIAGLDREWWSSKHNTHHVLTNHVGIDSDIDNRPFLFLWAPPKQLDGWWRRFQHVYFLFLYSFLYVSWRTISLKSALARGDRKALLFRLLPGYIWLAYLPLSVSIGSVFVGGFLVAIVVTLSHESEEIKTTMASSFVRNQFETTCDVICPDPVTSYLCGGMQYQLEHHLFPTLPRYKYGRLVPLVKHFAEENGLVYKALPLPAMCRRHFTTLKTASHVSSVQSEVAASSSSTMAGGYIGRWRNVG